MNHIFFKPPEGWAGDFIPFYSDGLFYLYYLRDIRSPRGHFDGVPWCLATTRDFVDFTDHGVVLEPGGYDDPDLCCYTGCVFKGPDTFHMFYVGMNPRMRAHGKPEQGFMHAVSDDLLHWRKLPGICCAPDGYEPHDWRDPFVFEEADGYHMLLAGRKDSGPRTRRGLTAHLISKDLYNWTVTEPLWAPDSYYTHECPDLFKVGGWYYLLFSEFTDKCRTRYVMSQSLDGPWTAPEDDVFDTRAYYAAKTWSDGRKRFLFGWNPTRVDGSDMKDFHWGGNLVVHEVFARPDHTLAVREPETVRDAWTREVPVTFNGYCEGTKLERADGMETLYADNAMPESFKLTAEITYAEGTDAFGLMLRADPEQDTSYGFIFSPNSRTLRFGALPEPSWNALLTRGLDRTVCLSPDRPVGVTLTVNGTMATLYVNGETALTTRMYHYQGSRLGLFVRQGSLSVDGARMRTGHPALS